MRAFVNITKSVNNQISMFSMGEEYKTQYKFENMRYFHNSRDKWQTKREEKQIHMQNNYSANREK